MLLSMNGVQVEYEQQGEGPDLLLLHSLLTELTVFEPVLPLLRGRRLTRINLPGFGASAPAVLETVGDHADHVAAAMDALKLPRSTAVFGNGFGAFVALELAIRHGGRFGPLVVADTLAAFPEPARAPFRGMAERVKASGMQAVLDTAINRMLPPEFAARHPDAVAKRKAALGAVDPGCFARACLGLAKLDLTAQVGSLRKPVLVMCGELDQTTPPALARALADAIPAASYAGIPHSGHCPMLEQPAELARMMDDFLRKNRG